MLALSIGDIRCQLLSSSHSCKTIQINPNISTPAAHPSPKKQKSKTSDASQATHATHAEQENHIVEVCREEDVGTLHISRIHLQLQRLLKDSNYSSEVLLTVIPQYKSKVHFTFDRESSLGGFSVASPRRKDPSVSPRPTTNRQSSRDVDSSSGRHSVSRQSSRASSDSRSGTLPR